MMRSSNRRLFDRRQPLLLFIALLLGLGLLAGCGGDDGDKDATTAAAETTTTTEASQSPETEGAETDESDAGETDNDSGSGEDEASTDEPRNEATEAVAVPPNRHKDSGGGSKQFRSKGGDNSIQDFGKEAQGDEFSTTAAIAHAFLDARAADNAAEACRYLASRIIDEMKQFAAQDPEAPGDCAGLVEMFTGGMDPKVRRSIGKADIASVRSDGEAAFVLYRGARNQVFLLPMAVENGQWKVAAIAASPMP